MGPDKPCAIGSPVLDGPKGRIAAFYCIACVASWSLVASFSGLGGAWEGGSGKFMGVLHVFGVMLAVLLVQGPMLKQPFLQPLGLNGEVSRYWLAAWFLPVAVLVGAIATAFALPHLDAVLTVEHLIEVKRSRMLPENLEGFEAYLLLNPPNHPFMLVVMALPMGLTINMALSLAEELGWRGFLWKELQGDIWKKSTIIGLLWGVWLVPAVTQGHIYPGHPVMGAVLIVLWCVLVSPIAAWVRVRTQSVIATAVFRGTLLSLTRPALDLTDGGDSLWQPMYGIAGIAGIALTLLALVFYERFVAAEPILVTKS